MKPFKVHLREKKNKNDQASLYLDFSRPVWHEAKNKYTRRHFLELYIYLNPKNKQEREHNRTVTALAQTEQAKVFLEIQNNVYGLAEHQKQAKDFLEFFKERANARKGKTRESWMSAFYHLNNYTGGKLTFQQVNKNFLLKLREYIDGLALSENSKVTYFSKIKCAVEEAHDRGLIRENFSVKGFAGKESPKAHLTNEDLEKLIKTEYPKSPILRRAAFFSILTSLRWSDCISITYEQIGYDKSLGYYLDFTIKKPGRPDRIYLNDEVLEWCEYEEGKTGRIFPLDEWKRRWVLGWLKLAGVRAVGGFHQFRHSFAIKTLNEGEDLVVVSAMMGHRRISSTQVYAKVLDKNKRAAFHRVSLRIKPEKE
jgi:integrase